MVGRWWLWALTGPLTGCLVLTPDFGETEGTTGTTAASSGAASGSDTADGVPTGSEDSGGTRGGSGSGDDSSGSTDTVDTTAAGACPNDAFENNDQEDAATILPGVSMAVPSHDLSARLEGDDESDWYVFAHDADVASEGDVSVVAEPNMIICAYVLCDSGVPGSDVNCTGGAPAVSPVQGLDGCCGDAGIDFGFTCASPVPDARIFVEITGPGGLMPGECDYSFGYAF